MKIRKHKKSATFATNGLWYIFPCLYQILKRFAIERKKRPHRQIEILKCEIHLIPNFTHAKAFRYIARASYLVVLLARWLILRKFVSLVNSFIFWKRLERPSVPHGEERSISSGCNSVRFCYGVLCHRNKIAIKVTQYSEPLCSVYVVPRQFLPG